MSGTPGAITISIVLEKGASLPSYATEGAAGMDLRSLDAIALSPGERKLIPLGLRIAIPSGYEAQIRPRSGLALEHGLSMVNTPGTIDSDFRGEVSVLMINHGSKPVRLEAGERVAQMVVCPVPKVEWNPVEQLDETERAEGGFGSTGTK